MRRLFRGLLIFCSLLPGFAAAQQVADVLRIDHYVQHVSTVPAIDGQHVQLYLRERVLSGTLARTGAFEGRVVLFVHGAGTPAEVAFDVPYRDYSWMGYLAAAGYDVFSVDTQGYGRSTRPHVMNDSCNLSPEDQITLRLNGAPCEPSATGQATTIQSDWDDIGRALAYIRQLRGVERVSLFGWSLGGPRAGGYAARFADEVDKLVLLAPAYRRDLSATQPAADRGPVMSFQSRDSFRTLWNSQVGCEGQYEDQVADAVWSQMLASDSVGATWGVGIRRAPRTLVWGWGEEAVERMQVPTLLIAPAHDAQVDPSRVRDLYEDIGSDSRVLLDLGCASHNAMWEVVHTEMFSASREWLDRGTVDGEANGIVRRGY